MAFDKNDRASVRSYVYTYIRKYVARYAEKVAASYFQAHVFELNKRINECIKITQDSQIGVQRVYDEMASIKVVLEKKEISQLINMHSTTLDELKIKIKEMKDFTESNKVHAAIESFEDLKQKLEDVLDRFSY